MSAPSQVKLPALRLPLQTGHALFKALSWIGLIQIVTMTPLIWVRSDELAFPLWGASVVLCVVAFWRFRASDMILEGAGLRVVGGRHHGMVRTWAELSGSSSSVQSERFGYALWLRGDFGMFVPLVTTFSLPEVRSFEALLSSLRTWDKRHETPKPGAPSVQIFRCHSCGAPLAPIEAPHAQCRYCGSWVPVTPWVVELARTARTREAEEPLDEREVRGVLRQRSATTVNLFALLAILVCALMPFGLYSHQHGQSETVIPTLALVFTVLALFRSILADRQAAMLLTLSFGARAPRAPGAPHECRVCGAPLSDLPGSSQLVFRCAYCHNDNILGLEYAAESSAAMKERRGLRAALRGRRIERFFIVSATLLVLVGAAGAIEFTHAPTIASELFRWGGPRMRIIRGVLDDAF